MITGKLAIDHVGITVPDLDQAITFFIDLFGFELVYRSDPYDEVGYVWPGDLESERATVRLAMLTHGGEHNVELLEYTNRQVPHRSDPPRAADPGGMHLCFYVEDIYEAERSLAGRDDIQFLCPVQVEEGGQISGIDWAYLITSFGLVIEFIRWRPGSLPYERLTTKRMVAPPWLRAGAR